MSERTGEPRRNRPAFRRRIRGARNVAANYIGAVAEGGVFLLLTPFLVRRLGLAWYGVWGLAVAFADWLPLLDLGLREALLKYVAAHQARADESAARRTIEAVVFVYLALGLVALAAVAGFAWTVLPWFTDDPDQVATLRTVFLVLGVSAAISLPAGAFGSVLEGLSRFDLLNLLRIGHQLLRMTLVVVALQLDLGLEGVAFAELLSRIALHGARFLAVKRTHPALLPLPRPHVDEIRRLAGLGTWNALRQVTEVATLRIYEPLLAAFSGIPAVGAFYAGRRFAAMPAEMIVPMAGVLLPLSSEMEAEGRHADLRRTLVESTKLALIAAFPLALLIGIGAPMIQTNWLGDRAPEAEAVMAIFAAVFVGVAASLPSEAVLLGLGRSRFVAICSLAHFLLTIGLGVPLTARFGAPGLAFAALAAILAAQVLLQIPAAARACGVSGTEWLRRALLPGLVAGVPVGAVMFLARDTVAVGGLAGLAAWGGGAIAAYGALCWFFGLTADEKAFLQEHASRIFLGVSRSDSEEGE